MPDSENLSQDGIAVSVIVITYNHAQYIKQCLDSILMQKTSFRFEVLVGDDASTDETQDILRDYEERYPDIFHMELREENLGPTKNAWDLFQKAQGKYLAHCEGDDYWTDENKLQLQYEILEDNPELSACAHIVGWINNARQPIPSQYEYFGPNERVTLDVWDGVRLFGQTNSFFERNRYLNGEHDYSIYLSHSFSGDLCIQLFMLLAGTVLILPNKMADYRRIVKVGGTNAVSRLYHDPKFAINFFNYWLSLENYCFREFSISKAFPRPKKAYFTSQINKLFHSKKKEALHDLFSIYQNSNNKLEYAGILIKHLCKRFFSWLISLPKRCYKGVRKRLHNDILDEFKALNQKITQLDQKCNRSVSNTNLLRVFLLRQETMMIDLLNASGIELPEEMLNVLEIREQEREKAERIKLERFAAIDQEHNDQLAETLERYNLPPVPEKGCMIAEEERLAAKWRVYELLKYSP